MFIDKIKFNGTEYRIGGKGYKTEEYNRTLLMINREVNNLDGALLVYNLVGNFFTNMLFQCNDLKELVLYDKFGEASDLTDMLIEAYYKHVDEKQEWLIGGYKVTIEKGRHTEMMIQFNRDGYVFDLFETINKNLL